MLEFKGITSAEDDARWEEHLLGFKDYNLWQSYAFGEYKGEGRTVIRTALYDGKRPIVMGQGVLKKNPFLSSAAFFMKGGPVYQLTNNESGNLKALKKYLAGLTDFMRQNFKFYYINMRLDVANFVDVNLVLRETGGTKPLFERSPCITYVLPIFDELDLNLKALNSKWRNQLRRSETFSPNFDSGENDDFVERYVKLHNEMCDTKSMKNFSITPEEIKALRACLGEKLFIIIGSSEGQDVCGSVVTLFGEKSYYYYAASNEEARSKYFSNAMVWHLIKELRAREIKEFDLMGVDPVENWGGYHFKRGIGGRPVEYMGEWEYASHKLMKVMINLGLYAKSLRMYR